MARPATGRLEQHRTSRGVSYVARFSAFGRRWHIKLGDCSTGMTEASANLALQAIIADVRRGRWLPEREEQQSPVEATMTFHALLAGLRISEACELRWRAIDFHNDTIRVEQVAKTAASFREIDLFPGLRRRLEHERQRRAKVRPGDRVFVTSAGTPRDRHNARQKIIIPVVVKADGLLIAENMSPLPVGVTAHKLRHTFASLLIAMGYDPATVQEQLGHSDARFTLNVYTHQMRRGAGDRAVLAKLLE